MPPIRIRSFNKVWGRPAIYTDNQWRGS